GAGLYATTLTDGTAAVTSREATAGVAAGRFSRDGLADLVTINPGSYTIDVLAGLRQGRFANPRAPPPKSPARVVRVEDFDRDGLLDLALLSDQELSVYLADVQGGFAAPVIYDAGLDPTGLSLADVNRDGSVDLLVGNSYGDVLILPGT